MKRPTHINNRTRPGWRLPISLGLALTWSVSAHAQVATAYVFSQSTGTYSPVSGGVVLGNTSTDDQRFVSTAAPLGSTSTLTGVGLPIGFSFTYDGVIYDRFAVNANGWISLGQSTNTPAVNITSTGGTNPNYQGFMSASNTITPAALRARLGAFGSDLQAQAGAELRFETIGAPGSHVLVVQWTNYRRWNQAGLSLNFQIRLNQADGSVEMHYGPMSWNATANFAQIGLGGLTAADYNNRTTTTDWNNTAAGASNLANNSFSTAVTPPTNGRVFRWAPPVPCAGMPMPGATTGPTEVLSGQSFELGLTNPTPGTGVSYEWYSSITSDSGPWASLGGNTPTITTSITQTTWFYAEVTCSTGPSMGASDVLQVELEPGVFVSNSPVGAIPDGSAAGMNIIIPVAGVSGTVTDIGLRLYGLAHTWVGDLNVRLTSPDNITHEVFLRVGRATGDCFTTGSPFGNGYDMNGDYFFNDGAAASLWSVASSPVPPGTYRTSACNVGTPTSIHATFGLPAAVGGNNINGDWVLFIADMGAGDTGSLQLAALDIDWLDCDQPAGTADPVNAGCATYDIMVDVSSVGDSPGGVDILIDNVLVQAGAGVGTYGPFGPYTTGTGYTVTLAHLDDAMCDINIPVVHTAPCDDNDPTTTDDCVGNACVNIPTPCDDGDANTVGDVLVFIDNGAVQNFDGVTAPALPAGWNTNGGGTDNPWVTQTTDFVSAPNAAFGANLATVSNWRLVSPLFNIASATAQLSFNHGWDFEVSTLPNTWDGGVLEININGGGWNDIIAAGGSWVTGGYNAVVSPNFGNPLAGMPAWGDWSGGVFINTLVNLPAAATGQSVRFRWRLGTDSSGSGYGWVVDDVTIIDEEVVCAGTPCTTDLFFAYDETTNYQDLVWTIYDQNTDLPIQTGGINPGEGSVPACVPDGCYYLVVENTAGNTISGGYRLQTSTGERLIDNTDNLELAAFATSGIADNEGFCVPMGTDKPIYTSCDRYWWESGNYLVATENSAVSDEFGVTNATSGYEFWFFDPNGGYSFRKFRNHATSDGFAPNNAVRACHIKLNNWAAANHLQENVLYNVRIRGVIDGTELPFGPACRLVIDPALNDCPPTGLNDIPGHPNFSCGVSRTFGGPNSAANRLYARSIAGADLYEWEFSNTDENYLVTRQSPTVIRHLNWTNAPAMNVNSLYQVRVRASKNGGATWCEWGWVCDVTIAPSVAPGGESLMLSGNGLAMWPNPNNGQELSLEIDGLADDVHTISVEIHDLSGKRIVARGLAAQHGIMVMNLNGDLAAGTYVVTVVAGEQRHVERLVIAD